MLKKQHYTDFDSIKRYIYEHEIKFLILDFNGVLDDYYQRKNNHLIDIVDSDQYHYLPELMLFIDKEYILDRTATIERSVGKFYASKGISLSEELEEKLARPMPSSRITNSARLFLDSLNIPFVIYTSLSDVQLKKALGRFKCEVFTRDLAHEDKPSIFNLKCILEKYGFSEEESCVVGDGLIDDLMPASLLGIHTILVSPYASILAKN